MNSIPIPETVTRERLLILKNSTLVNQTLLGDGDLLLGFEDGLKGGDGGVGGGDGDGETLVGIYAEVDGDGHGIWDLLREGWGVC